MGNQSKVSEYVLSVMHQFLENEKRNNGAGELPDLVFLTDSGWLKDSSVIDVITNRKGSWEVSMIFAHYKNPVQFIVRNITTCFSKEKAQMTAFYIRKDASKDRRGTLNLSITDLNLCYN